MTDTPSTDPAPVDEPDEPTAFAYSQSMSARITLDEAAWKRFCEVAGLNLDGSPREDPPTD